MCKHRKESILDSNALAVTLAFAQVFNLLRIRDVAVEEEEFIRVTRGWTRLEFLVQMLYCGANLLETCEAKISSFWPNTKAYRADVTDRGVIILHSFMMAGMVFVHVNKASLGKVLSVTRCSCFTAASITWAYVIGVPALLKSLHMQESSKEHEQREGDARLINTVHIHLRFAYILVVDLPLVFVCLPVQFGILLYKAIQVWSDDKMEMTHPSFFIYQDVLVDPFNVCTPLLTNFFHASTSKKNVLPIIKMDDKPGEGQDDIAAQFRLARATNNK